MSDLWKTNQYGVSISKLENFEDWHWGPVKRADALYCMEAVVEAIEENAMACLTNERGVPEVNIGILGFEYEFAAKLSVLVENWVSDRTGLRDRLDESCAWDARQWLAEFEHAACVIRKALAPVHSTEPLALD